MTITQPLESAAPPCPTSSQRSIGVGVFGASGTTGTELTKLLVGHPQARLAFATSRRLAGASLREVDPSAPDVTLQHPDRVALSAVDVAFVCLPHGHAAAMAARVVEAGVRCIDLSGDLRLRSEDEHQSVYGTPRPEGLAARALYGLSEAVRERLPGAALVSNPGCYPTCAAAALRPLARAGVLEDPVIINAVSGVSGAGREATATTHFCSVAEDVRPYKLGRAHRHTAEIEQGLASWVPQDCRPPSVVFNPHLVPLERGMLTTIVARVSAITAREVHELLEHSYWSDPFVRVLPYGEPARIRAAIRTNAAVVGVNDVAGRGLVVLTSAIDNLLKGAAGQALQNMNLMFGFPETAGAGASIAARIPHSRWSWGTA